MSKSSVWGGVGVVLALGLAAWVVLDARGPAEETARGDAAMRIAELEAENEFLKHKNEQLEAWRALTTGDTPREPDGPALSGAASSEQAARRHTARRTRGPDPDLSPGVFIKGLRRALKAGQKNLLQSYRTALFALGQVSVPPLLAILRDAREDEALRIEVLAVLSVLQADALEGPVTDILNQPGTSVVLQKAALKYLPIREGMQIPALVTQLAGDREADWSQRQTALRILVGGAPDSAIPELRRMLESGDKNERGRAIKLLIQAKSPALRPLVTELVEDEDFAAHVQSLLPALAAMKGKGWATVQMTGPPDTPIAGDLVTAWASKTGNMGDVWIELDYERSVVPEEVRIHETYNAGAVKQVLARQPGARWAVLWEGEAAPAHTPRWFSPRLMHARHPTKTIRIWLDTNKVPGWNEIDAVELVGDGYRMWAVKARASSSYAGE